MVQKRGEEQKGWGKGKEKEKNKWEGKTASWTDRTLSNLSQLLSAGEVFNIFTYYLLVLSYHQGFLQHFYLLSNNTIISLRLST